jgi:chemotaxis protein methyltransferase CheR
VRILATDISRRMLDKAGQAVYPKQAIEEVPSPQYRKYFIPLRNGRPGTVQVGAEARELVHLAYLNLMEPWPMRGRFHVIFCRRDDCFDRPTAGIRPSPDVLRTAAICSWGTRKACQRPPSL